MAKTYPIQQLKVVYPHDMSAAAVYLPEGASQTFVAGAPVKFASGLVVTCDADPDTDEKAIGFALEDAHNGSAGANMVKVMPLMADVYVEVNYLAADGSDQALATAVLGAVVELSKTTISGEVIWHGDPASGGKEALRCVGFKTTTLIPNSSEVEAANGDTNARILCVPRDGWNAWKA